jgi:hypothetical protein
MPEYHEPIAKKYYSSIVGDLREAKEEEKVGRTTGSLEWRRERGELGTNTPKTQEQIKVEVQRLFKQLTVGCSKETCGNEQCHKSPACATRTPNESALEALNLIKTGKANFCEEL